MKTIRYRPLAAGALAAGLLGLTLAWQLGAAEKAGPERWRKAIEAFEAADKENPPPQGAILFIGSSTIVRWKTLAKDFPEHQVINRGFGGSQIADSVFYADRIVIPYRPRLIVFRAGGNDINAGKTPEQVAADFQAFVEKVRTKLPEVRVAYLTINASPARWKNVELEKKTNQLIKQYIASGKNLDYIDTFDATLGHDGKPREDLFAKDRLHFNEEGYKVLTSIVRDHLKQASP
jgi:lysophospholipase L1-like esterase